MIEVFGPLDHQEKLEMWNVELMEGSSGMRLEFDGSSQEEHAGS